MNFVNLLPIGLRCPRVPGVNDGSFITFKKAAGDNAVQNMSPTIEDSYATVDNVYCRVVNSTNANLPASNPDTIFIVPEHIALGAGRSDLAYPMNLTMLNESNADCECITIVRV